jgi:HAD superfamily hydrolase (TIGR01490 family)
MNKSIAFFDLDGTITTKDTFIDFIIFCKGRIFFFFGIIVLSPFILLFFVGIYPNFRLKELFFKFYLSNSFTADELLSLGNLYASTILPKIMYQEALEKISWHKNKNHRVVILTASSSIWLSKWCEINNLELIGTEFCIDNGRYTGRIDGENCYGKRKFIIVKNILNESLTEVSYGYGDSKADIYFLKEVKYSFYRPSWL